MQADRDDAPVYLRRKGWPYTSKKWAIPTLASTVIVLGALHFASSALLQNTVRSLANKHQSQSYPVAQGTRPTATDNQDKWDRLVDEQYRRDNPRATIQPATEPALPAIPKQTVYHDQNYTPRGADNVLPLRPFPSPQEPIRQPQPQGTRFTIVGETRSTKDRVCWPYREGSIERRNCKFSVGLSNRDRD